MSAYYNEIDPFAAQWLRDLIEAGHIAPGEVDTRSIEDVTPRDLEGFTQCHFFAGIGGWSRALRLAEWKDESHVWTGSCPCQPFSQAGKGEGVADERHLWPAWYHLIRECRPSVIFGEQVASPDALVWLDIVQPNLEAADYACGVFDLCAAGVGAPHLRQRLYFVADTDSVPGGERGSDFRGWDPRGVEESRARSGGSGVPGYVAVPRSERCEGRGVHVQSGRPQSTGSPSPRSGEARVLADSSLSGENSLSPGPVNGFWRDAEWVLCRDEPVNKWRPVEPGTFPLAYGVSARVGRLRGYGNAINPEVAAELIRSYLDLCPEAVTT